jgi:hypothetical protein
MIPYPKGSSGNAAGLPGPKVGRAKKEGYISPYFS